LAKGEVRGASRCALIIAALLFSASPASRAEAQVKSNATPKLQATQAEGEIRARRQSSNLAIARHDTAGIGAILADSVLIVTSASLKQVGRSASLTSFADQFRQRPDVVYLRTPDAVTVFAPWQMASERGHWTGSWTNADGKVSIGGSYFAKWRLIKGAWMVEAETYVPERCTGSKFCSTVP
jgi:hypothetical protein